MQAVLEQCSGECFCGRSLYVACVVWLPQTFIPTVGQASQFSCKMRSSSSREFFSHSF